MKVECHRFFSSLFFKNLNYVENSYTSSCNTYYSAYCSLLLWHSSKRISNFSNLFFSNKLSCAGNTVFFCEHNYWQLQSSRLIMEHRSYRLCLADCLFIWMGTSYDFHRRFDYALGRKTHFQLCAKRRLFLAFLGRRRRLPMGNFESKTRISSALEMVYVQLVFYLFVSNGFSDAYCFSND